MRSLCEVTRCIGTTWLGSNWPRPHSKRLSYIHSSAQICSWAYVSQPAVSGKHADQVYNISPVVGASKFQKNLNEPVMKLANQLFTGKVFTSPVTPQILQLQTELNTAFEAVQQGAASARDALATGQKNLDQAAAQGR